MSDSDCTPGREPHSVAASTVDFISMWYTGHVGYYPHKYKETNSFLLTTTGLKQLTISREITTKFINGYVEMVRGHADILWISGDVDHLQQAETCT